MSQKLLSRNEEIWGIITGDLIRSSQLPLAERNRVVDFLIADSRDLLGKFSPGCKFLFPEIFRGDSWQMGVFPAHLAFRNGLFIRASLKARFNNLDSRLAVGIGGVAFVPQDRVSTGIGSAYTLSGELLDGMGEERMLLRTIKDPRGRTRCGRAMDLILRFMDEQVTRWTPAQAQAALGALQQKNQVQIARQWQPKPIRQQAVSRHLQAASWRCVGDGVAYIESLIAEWDKLEEAGIDHE